MKHNTTVHLISAKEAKTQAKDNFDIRQSRVLTVLDIILKKINEDIHYAVSRGEFEKHINLDTLHELNRRDREAAKEVVIRLSGLLEEKGYTFTEFNNYSHFLIIYWR